ncbi:MAG: gephyrin-like molybdotransferase Glp [Pseudomonadota bacterium]
MISVEEAEARILQSFTPVGQEWVTLDRAQDRVLAADLAAQRTQPPSPVSAMDGYAVRAQDTAAQKKLDVIGEIPAGQSFDKPIGTGEAVRIFTGAPLPENSDAILIQENVRRREDVITYETAIEAGRYVREAGLDFKQGWVGLRRGSILGPQALGLAATLGHFWLPVRRRPRIGLIATGDELAWPGTTPAVHQHVSSNTTTLAAMCRRWGAETVDLGIAKDTIRSLRDATANLHGLDLLVTTGGASVGEYDLVRSAFEDQQLQLDFWRIAMRPGKPLMFGQLRGVPTLGLPGNPVSASVCALVFLRPIVAKLLDRQLTILKKSARISAQLGPNDERKDFLRAKLNRLDGEIWAETAPRQDSSMFATFAHADALVVRPPHDGKKSVGDSIAIVEIHDLL